MSREVDDPEHADRDDKHRRRRADAKPDDGKGDPGKTWDWTQNADNPGSQAFCSPVHARDDAERHPESGTNAQTRDIMAEAAAHGFQPSPTCDFLQKGRRDCTGTRQHRRIDETQTRNGLPQPKKDEEADARKQEKAHKGLVAVGGAFKEARLKQAFERQFLVEGTQLDLIGLHEA
jgi:hypothetical protein